MRLDTGHKAGTSALVLSHCQDIVMKKSQVGTSEAFIATLAVYLSDLLILQFPEPTASLQ